MPTSSQALILLSVDNSAPLGQRIPQINQFQSPTPRNSDHTNQLLPSSLQSPIACQHRVSPPKTEYFGRTQCTTTCLADYTQPTNTSLYSSFEHMYQHEPSTAMEKHVTATTTMRTNATDYWFPKANDHYMTGKSIFDSKHGCPRTDNKNLIYLTPKTANPHHFTGGRYFSRLPRSFTENSYYEQRSYNQSQVNLTTNRNPIEMVKPVLEIRKSQQFHKPLQSLNTLHNNITIMPLDTDSYQRSSVTSFASYEANTNKLIQRLRSLGFRPYGNWSCDSNDEKQTIYEKDGLKFDSSSPIFSSLQDNEDINCLRVKIAAGLSISDEEIKKQLRCYVENGVEQEKVEKLVADIKSRLRRKKTKPPTVRLRKILPKPQPLTVCFACDPSLQITHEDIKQELDSQYPGIVVLSLRFDPVSVAVGNSCTKNRWVVRVGNTNDYQSLIKGGVTIGGSDRITIKPLDAVMVEEYNAYKLQQYVKEAKSMIAQTKSERMKQSKKVKNKRIKAKVIFTGM